MITWDEASGIETMHHASEKRRDTWTAKQLRHGASRLIRLAEELEEAASIMDKQKVNAIEVDGQTKLGTGIAKYVQPFVDNVGTALKKERRRRESAELKKG